MTAARFETLTAGVELEFPEYETPPAEPLGLVRAWVARACELGVREPKALALATADAFGRPSSRIVTIIAITDAGLLFASHACSQKGRELSVNPWASGLLYWRETGQQLIVSGPVVPLSGGESDDLWFARPVALHPATTVSRQSEPLHDVAAMRAEITSLEPCAAPLPRPERFTGYRLEPATVEFWCASGDRLHRRLQYTRVRGGWETTRLQP
ncbi:phenazine biosynthesis FMN-dependent oxidase PhzG [Solirubrobacter phytolaccae]|uniref:Phenazine biosynthesis FMN-dependent oxidase PhzG n=1 Tax=Solirubrobacter phytolaccae TaxID=1404360 RepID=A0A9X3S8N5_9ACTN|nr:phenazine biosynthesis FMN-dependent oxidase PhzG [Solirubrobacter phytolaccae]MDA0181698.1 phenazine biosynthesis FMN-dependent oxidase PhzG [Solirubrobacter phytolaccae]